MDPASEPLPSEGSTSLSPESDGASPSSTTKSPSTPPTPETTSPASESTGPAPESTGPAPPPESPTHSETSKGPSPEEPPVIEVAGPSVDNSYPAAWGIFPDPMTQCSSLYLATQQLDVPLRVVSQSATAPFEVATPLAADCLGDTGITRPSCAGHVFPAGPVDDSERCWMAVGLPVSADGVDHTHGASSVVLEGVCRSAVGFVCSRAAQARPSPTRPVRVVLREQSLLQACLASVPDANADAPDGGEMYLVVDDNCKMPS